jgi:hypothetical protein
LSICQEIHQSLRNTSSRWATVYHLDFTEAVH